MPFNMLNHPSSLPATLAEGLTELPEANLVLLSLPGRHVAREALAAFRHGLHVMIISQDVPLEDEVMIKQVAAEKNLLAMGPDCHTAMISSMALGFGNAVRRGPIGIVSACDTGAQEVMRLIHHRGLGISHVIGTGSRDISNEIGGSMMMRGIQLLAEDPATEVMVLLSKPPNMSLTANLLDTAAATGKPTVVCFLGGHAALIRGRGMGAAPTLEQAAERAVALAHDDVYIPVPFTGDQKKIMARARMAASGLSGKAKYIRGLYTGSALAEDALIALSEVFRELYSNRPLEGVRLMQDPLCSEGHCLLHLGDPGLQSDEISLLRSPAGRNNRLLEEARDPEVAVILLDFILGFSAHPDPVGQALPAIDQARTEAADSHHQPVFVASVTGTERDIQDAEGQLEALRDAGVEVLPSNAQAARFGALVATRGEVNFE